jgi:predicted lactoylglutathione lyase
VQSLKAIYVNLPTRDLDKTRIFWTNLGFSFNEQFSNEQALCLELKKEMIYAMLISHELFKTFTHKPISDNSATQVLIAIEVETREKVDQLVSLAFENGATRYRDSADHGWMYYDSFADLDGHQWEVLFSDMTLIG